MIQNIGGLKKESEMSQNSDVVVVGAGPSGLIAAERPDMLPKLAKLRMPLKEVYAKVTSLSKPVVG